MIHTADANNNLEQMRAIIQNDDFTEKYSVLLEIAKICQLKCTLALMETGLTRAQSSSMAESTFSEIRRQDSQSENEGTSLTALRSRVYSSTGDAGFCY